MDIISGVEFLLVCMVMGAGAALQGSIGYGMALLAGPFLILIEPRFVPGPLLFAGITLNLLVTLREKRSIDFWGLKWALAGRIPATIVAGLIIAAIPEGFVTIVFGILVLLAVGISISGVRFPAKRGVLFSAGVLSGIMGTFASIGGPPIALVYQDAPGDKLRATLSGFFIVGTTFSVLILASVGRFGITEMGLSMTVVPGVIMGFLLSSKIVPHLERKYLHIAVLTIAAISGFVVIARQVFPL